MPPCQLTSACGPSQRSPGVCLAATTQPSTASLPQSTPAQPSGQLAPPALSSRNSSRGQQGCRPPMLPLLRALHRGLDALPSRRVPEGSNCWGCGASRPAGRRCSWPSLWPTLLRSRRLPTRSPSQSRTPSTTPTAPPCRLRRRRVPACQCLPTAPAGLLPAVALTLAAHLLEGAT
jgi:hypothetical protein